MKHYCWWLRGKEHTDMARLSIASVLRVDPKAHCAIVTDEPKTTPIIDGIERIELPSGRPAMVANLDAQIAYVSRLWAGIEVMFLDADVLMRKPFDIVRHVDLTATWRDHVGYSEGEKVSGVATLMPYNYGVFGVSVSTLTIEALMWMRARILRMATQYQNWYGNQMALAELLGKAPTEGVVFREARIRWSPMDGGTCLSCALLPCDQYNYSPESENEDVSDKYAVHLKGDRKAWMQAYAA